MQTAGVHVYVCAGGGVGAGLAGLVLQHTRAQMGKDLLRCRKMRASVLVLGAVTVESYSESVQAVGDLSNANQRETLESSKALPACCSATVIVEGVFLPLGMKSALPFEGGKRSVLSPHT
jgi:hypothetical protein